MLMLKLQNFGHLMWMKSQLIGKDPDAGKDWRQEEKGMTEDETVGWHHWLNGCEFEQTPEAWRANSPWGHKKHNSATEEQQQTLHSFQKEFNIALFLT